MQRSTMIRILFLLYVEMCAGHIGGLSFSWLVTNQRTLWKAGINATGDQVLDNQPYNGVAEVLYKAWQIFGNTNGIIPSITDFANIEHQIGRLSKGRVKLVPISVPQCVELSNDGKLILNQLEGQKVAVIYRNTAPLAYNESQWNAIRMVFAAPGMMERSLHDQIKIVPFMQSNFAGLWNLNDRQDDDCQRAIAQNLVACKKFLSQLVMKDGFRNVSNKTINADEEKENLLESVHRREEQTQKLKVVEQNDNNLPDIICVTDVIRNKLVVKIGQKIAKDELVGLDNSMEPNEAISSATFTLESPNRWEYLMFATSGTPNWQPEGRRRTAEHECSHALCHFIFEEADPINFLYVRPGNSNLQAGERSGVTSSSPRRHYTRSQLLTRLFCVAAGSKGEHLLNSDHMPSAPDIEKMKELAMIIYYRFDHLHQTTIRNAHQLKTLLPNDLSDVWDQGYEVCHQAETTILNELKKDENLRKIRNCAATVLTKEDGLLGRNDLIRLFGRPKSTDPRWSEPVTHTKPEMLSGQLNRLSKDGQKFLNESGMDNDAMNLCALLAHQQSKTDADEQPIAHH